MQDNNFYWAAGVECDVIQDRIGLSIAELVAGHADQCSFLAVQKKVEHRVQSVTC